MVFFDFAIGGMVARSGDRDPLPAPVHHPPRRSDFLEGFNNLESDRSVLPLGYPPGPPPGPPRVWAAESPVHKDGALPFFALSVTGRYAR